MIWTKKQNRRQKFRWFCDAFTVSLLAVFFMIGFAWVAAGSCAISGEEVASVGVRHDTPAPDQEKPPALTIELLGFRGEVPLQFLGNAVQIYKHYAVLLPAKFRLFVDLIALAAGSLG